MHVLPPLSWLSGRASKPQRRRFFLLLLNAHDGRVCRDLQVVEDPAAMSPMTCHRCHTWSGPDAPAYEIPSFACGLPGILSPDWHILYPDK